MIVSMRNGKMNAIRSTLLEYCCGFAGNVEFGHSILMRDDLDILPGDLSAPAGLNSL